VLALTRDRATVYEGNRYAREPAPLADDFPSRLEQVVIRERSEPGLSVASSSAGVDSVKMLRGTARGKHDADTEKFFPAVSEAVAAQFSKPCGLPLVLAALAEHHAMFRDASQNPLLVADGLSANPGALSADVPAAIYRFQDGEPPHLSSRPIPNTGSRPINSRRWVHGFNAEQDARS
jgi:hypothetical protein